VPGVRGGLGFGEGSRGDSSSVHPVRAGTGRAGLSEASGGVPGGGLPTSVVYRVAARGPGPREGHIDLFTTRADGTVMSDAGPRGEQLAAVRRFL
jgi:hypothetical protein